MSCCHCILLARALREPGYLFYLKRHDPSKKYGKHVKFEGREDASIYLMSGVRFESMVFGGDSFETRVRLGMQQIRSMIRVISVIRKGTETMEQFSTLWVLWIY